MFHKINLGNRILEFYERAFRLLGKDCTSIFSDLLEMDTSKKNSHIIKMVGVKNGLLTHYMNQRFPMIENISVLEEL